MKSFVLLGNSPRVALPVLQAAFSMGAGGCAVVGGKTSRSLRWSRLCRRHVRVELCEDDAAVQAINRLAAEMPHPTLVPYDCDAVRLYNRVSGRLRIATFPVPDTPTLDLLDDKWLFHRFCLQQGLPVPATRYIGAKWRLDFIALQSEFGLPFVVKPTNCSGSEGVRIVRRRADLEHGILSDPSYDFQSLIVQRYVKGIDMDINVLAIHGRLAACSVHRTRGSRIEFLQHAGQEDAARQLCQGSGYHGVMNVDVRLERGSGRFFLIEANPRFWATLAAPVGCGLNFLAEGLEPAQAEAAPRLLTAASFQMRHPLLTPRVWPQIHNEHSAVARLQRARLFDPYSVGQLVQEVPAMAWRAALRSRRVLGGKTPQAA